MNRNRTETEYALCSSLGKSLSCTKAYSSEIQWTTPLPGNYIACTLKTNNTDDTDKKLYEIVSCDKSNDLEDVKLSYAICQNVDKSLSCADALSLDDPILPNGSYDEELPPGLVYCLLSQPDKKLGGGFTIEKCAKTFSPSMLKTGGDRAAENLLGCPNDCECCEYCFQNGCQGWNGCDLDDSCLCDECRLLL